ncbi:pilus assembly protein TadG-related protein [Tautonia sp. JC769]|uniref:pilus assembly protein TadG-related protein n=1 Tax=Tautonia sp. JC769 TaxID=3232135 RepID=UPI00345781AF
MRTRRLRDRASSARRGTVAVLVAFSMIVLLGILALVLDGGLLLIERRHAQAAADSAALAASLAFQDEGGDLSAARSAALSYAAANGFPEGDGNTLTLNAPPASGRFAGDDSHLEVILTSRSPRYFSAIWGADALTVSARAVARGGPESSASLILLDPNRSGALALMGQGKIVTDAGIQVNSIHPTAVTASNTGHTRAATAGKPGVPVIKVAGNYATSSGGYFSGQVKTGSPPVADPLANLPVPPQAGHVYNGLPFPQWGTRTMHPGVYQGGVTLGGGMRITMEPGTYYMRNGGFTVANGVRITGHEVMIYVDPNGGRFSFQGGGQIDLTPPTSGPFEGITLYQDRNSTQDISIANGSTTTISGTIYAAGARVSFAGGAQFNQFGTRFIAKSMEISNNAFVGVGGDDSPGNASVKLVE